MEYIDSLIFTYIFRHNIDELEKENKPEQMAAIFKGSDSEKIATIKKG